MITSLEFDAALKIISDYKIQLDNKIVEKPHVMPQNINIQKSIRNSTFNALRYYYFEYYNITLSREDLMNMDVLLLKEIDYTKMSRYRGFGLISLFYFKKLMESHSVIAPELEY
jgi:hypothetical protein